MTTYFWQQLQLKSEQTRCSLGMNGLHYTMLHSWKGHRQVRIADYQFGNATHLLAAPPVSQAQPESEPKGWIESASAWWNGDQPAAPVYDIEDPRLTTNDHLEQGSRGHHSLPCQCERWMSHRPESLLDDELYHAAKYVR